MQDGSRPVLNYRNTFPKPRSNHLLIMMCLQGCSNYFGMGQKKYLSITYQFVLWIFSKWSVSSSSFCSTFSLNKDTVSLQKTILITNHISEYQSYSSIKRKTYLMKRWLICLAISSLIPASFSISYVSGSWTKSISLKLPFSEQSDRKLLTDPYRDLFMTPNLAPSVKKY